MSNNWFFYYQEKGGKEIWKPELADCRDDIIQRIKPAFVSVLDVCNIPKDNQWEKARYRGPMYLDFDAEGDIPAALSGTRKFLDRLRDEIGFDTRQALLFASGGKGFHIEIPQKCFMLKVPSAGSAWLPYVYREIAQSFMVDTLDLKVYSGRSGRMWRTPGVMRDTGNYKVPLTLEELQDLDSVSYADLVKSPRKIGPPNPPVVNGQFALRFEKARTTVATKMRGKGHRQAKAHEVLDRWIKAKKTPPSIESLMSGEKVAKGAGFQDLAMQIAIYAVSVDMSSNDMVERCTGLIERHESDSSRYNSSPKRKEELRRMWDYMKSNDLYDFEVGPIVALLKPGTSVADLGVIDKTDTGDVKEGQAVEAPAYDPQIGIRQGFIMNSTGMWRQRGDNTEALCRATLRDIEQVRDLDGDEFQGYEFDLVVNNKILKRSILPPDSFHSSSNLRKYFVSQQISFQGGEPETMALLDVMSDKVELATKTYIYPREGLFVVDKPGVRGKEPIKVYLTQDTFLSSANKGDEGYFRLRYKPNQATSSYNIDLHNAPDLDESMVPVLHDLFHFNKPDVVADMVGWFVASHYRSFYLHTFKQFPLLQVFGVAGSGKSQTVQMLAAMHWYQTPISIISAMASTPFALDTAASTSTSAPMMIDEYKPRELRQMRGKLEKLKDVFKNSYIAAEIGGRGTVNRGSVNSLSLIKNKSTAPILFMGESLETETAIVERCVTVQLSPAFHTRARHSAFRRLQNNTHVLSALGRAIIEAGFRINLEAMKDEIQTILNRFDEQLPDFDDSTRRRIAPRLMFNRAVIVHSMSILKRILAAQFGTEFDEEITELMQPKVDGEASDADRVAAVHGISEISKVLNAIARLSRERGTNYQMVKGRDYVVDEHTLDLNAEAAYHRYRVYTAAIHDTPLYDNVQAFLTALSNYEPCIDHAVASSPLQTEGGSEHILRFDTRRLKKEGVQTFST